MWIMSLSGFSPAIWASNSDLDISEPAKVKIKIGPIIFFFFKKATSSDENDNKSERYRVNCFLLIVVCESFRLWMTLPQAPVSTSYI